MSARRRHEPQSLSRCAIVDNNTSTCFLFEDVAEVSVASEKPEDALSGIHYRPLDQCCVTMNGISKAEAPVTVSLGDLRKGEICLALRLRIMR